MIDLVVIGSSLGGLDALQILLADLSPEMPPIAIAQHRMPDPDGRLCDLLAARCPLPVIEPDDKAAIVPGNVYLAPSDYHLLVERGWFSLSTEGAVQFARPSIDVLFDTAADAYGAGVLAVVLTCASLDGVDGASTIHRRGGQIFVQDPGEARSPILPAAVIAEGLATKVAPLDELRRLMIRACATSIRTSSRR